MLSHEQLSKFIGYLSLSFVVLVPYFAQCVIPDRASIVPLTHQEILTFVEQARSQLADGVAQQLATRESQKTPNNTIGAWNRTMGDLLNNLATLRFLASSKGTFTQDALQGMNNLQKAAYGAISANSALQLSMLTYANSALNEGMTLTPYDYYQVSQLLDTIAKGKDQLSPDQQRLLANLKIEVAKRPQTPWEYLKGQAPEKNSSENSFTVLSLNTCFVPGSMGYIHGGVKPWRGRVLPLADKIRKANPDIVCLQEVQSEDASRSIYDALKNDYAHFYGSIGPRQVGTDAERLGLPSGLFVASKYPLDSPQFTLYDAVGYPMNWGAFDFVVKNGNKTIGHVYTTHLQSLNEEHFSEIREKQLKQLLAKMEKDYLATSDKTLPFLLTGDFNIAWGTKEPGEALLSRYFLDAYNKGQTVVDLNNSTWDDFFSSNFLSTNQIPIEIPPNFGTLDYALLLQRLPSKPNVELNPNSTIQTIRVMTNNRAEPNSALSDHQGLLTTVTSKK